MKKSNKCNLYKELSEFDNRKDTNDLKDYQCKSCKKKYNKSRYTKKRKEIRQKQSEYRKENKKSLNSKSLQYFHENKDRLNKARRDRYKSNREVEVENRRSRYLENPEKYKEINRVWVEKNKESRREYLRFYSAYRRALKKKATIGDFNKEIREIYKNCPEGYEVDHIIPLQGNGFTGLHVPWYLQYLPISVNRSKGNKILGD